MATNINEKIKDIDDISKGVQRKSTIFQTNEGEVSLAVNSDFGRIGGAQKIYGYTQLGVAITTTTSTSSSTSTSTSTTTSSSTSTSTSTSTSSSTSSSTSTSSTTTGA